MLYSFQLPYETFVGFGGVEPELGAIGDGGDDNCFVEELEVGGGDTVDGVTKDFEACDDSKPFGCKEVDVMVECEVSV